MIGTTVSEWCVLLERWRKKYKKWNGAVVGDRSKTH